MKRLTRPWLLLLLLGLLGAGCAAETEYSEPAVRAEPAASALFARYDTDADGYLSEPEFDAGVGETGLFGTYDLDADEHLTVSEFDAYERTLDAEEGAL
jgi:hypothetical protein